MDRSIASLFSSISLVVKSDRWPDGVLGNNNITNTEGCGICPSFDSWLVRDMDDQINSFMIIDVTGIVVFIQVNLSLLEVVLSQAQESECTQYDGCRTSHFKSILRRLVDMRNKFRKTQLGCPYHPLFFAVYSERRNVEFQYKFCKWLL